MISEKIKRTKKTSSSKENRKKSINGSNLEKEFKFKTGYDKAKKSQKPTFINQYGLTQIIDFDFIIEQNGIKYYIDLTASYRSDRAKQKAYNGYLLKTKTNIVHKFIIGVKTFIERGEIITATPLEGIDEICLVSELIERFKKA